METKNRWGFLSSFPFGHRYHKKEKLGGVMPTRQSKLSATVPLFSLKEATLGYGEPGALQNVTPPSHASAWRLSLYTVTI